MKQFKQQLTAKGLSACLFLFLLVASLYNYAQLADGGIPIDVTQLKSARVISDRIITPEFKQKETIDFTAEDLLSKTIQYAHSFEVSLTPNNSGQWFDAGAYKVWQLEIESEGAKGIGLIFTRYHLPEGARLFLFDKDKKNIFGAYTHLNNKPFRKLAVYPFPGDHLILQYEIPENVQNDFELELGKINHDFVGVNNLKANRWPQRMSGDCNVDINCDLTVQTEDVQRSVMRILSDNELGTGTLLNNTAEDGKPYVISAFHIYDNNEGAEITLYDFNYESPFCIDMDGYDNQSISGATAVASYDSLDFMLVELSAVPPAVFRPYYAGWDATNTPPSRNFTIHHPQGDVKKLSIDEGTCDSMSFSGDFHKMSHWKVLNWEVGTTEKGSSGAGLFNGDQLLCGTLSGGAASCDNLAYDAFARFDKMWDFSSRPDRSVSTWLNPERNGTRRMQGMDLYRTAETGCALASNFLIDDEAVVQNNGLAGIHIDEVAEKFNSIESGILSGVAIGIDHIVEKTSSPELVIRLYDNDISSETHDIEFRYKLSSITEGAMNYFSFTEPVEVSDEFFISLGVGDENDSVIVYRSAYRNLNNSNTMYFQQNGEWINASEFDVKGRSTSCLMQVNACGASFQQSKDSLDENLLMTFYPNPVADFLTVEFSNFNVGNDLKISDMTGRVLFSECYELKTYATIDLSVFQPGIYVLSLESDGKNSSSTFTIY